MTKKSFVALIIFSITTLPAPAHAYIDASSGAMILQMILGGIAGAVVAIKFYGKHMWAKLTGKKDSEQQSVGSESDK